MKDITSEISHQVIVSINLLRHLQHIHIPIRRQVQTELARSLSQPHRERFFLR
jgi:hypothetical protein